ncbi:MAG: hypothetical protein HYV42_03970 [Candidatus Magasanikbacteria bacterium]|nr:hypothetical protein [Candidatus Magasanikbacteria bacterium]
MPEPSPYLESAARDKEKYKYVTNPNSFRAEDVFRARFVEVEKAVKNNPEKRGVATAILAACYLAFGSERVDLKRLGPDALPPRLNGYLVAYNDEVDIAEKIKDTDPEVYQLIMNHVKKYQEKFEQYFEPTGDAEEDGRRQKFKKFYDVAFKEVDATERELFTVKKPEGAGAADNDILAGEIERIQKGRELVNAIEILMNIRACVEEDIFSDRGIDEAGARDIAGLAQKYDWLINSDYEDKELTEDERKARMLFFATMSNQAALDEIDFQEDRCFEIWKKMTYLTEVKKVPPKEAARIVQEDAARYAALAAKSGMSPVPLWFANKGARALSHVKNIWRGFIAGRAERHGHIREKAVAMLQKKHPGKYKM